MKNNLFEKYKSVYDIYLDSEEVSLALFCKTHNISYENTRYNFKKFGFELKVEDIKTKYVVLHKEYIDSDCNSLKEFCRRKNLSYGFIHRQFTKFELQLFIAKRDRKYTESVYKEIYTKHFNDFIPITVLAKEYGIPRITLDRNLKHLNLETHRNFQESSIIDHRFLDCIDTPLKAYFLGWVYSDGSIGADIQVSMAATDSYILDMFKANFGGHIYYSKPRQEHHKEMASYRLASVHAKSKLIEMGCRQRKSAEGMTYPNLDPNLERFFILGFFDGDGSVYKCQRNKKFKFISTDKVFLKHIESALEKIGCFGAGYSCYQSKHPVYHLVYGNRLARELVMAYFYKNNDTLYLKRKYNKFLELATPSKSIIVKDN